MERFTTVCDEPAQHQAAVLRHLLHLHRGTAHLKKHDVHVPTEFGEPAAGALDSTAASTDAAAAALSLLRQLPLTTYGDYAALIDEAVEAGRAVSEAEPATQQRWEAAVAALTGAQPVYAFWCSSGGSPAPSAGWCAGWREHVTGSHTLWSIGTAPPLATHLAGHTPDAPPPCRHHGRTEAAARLHALSASQHQGECGQTCLLLFGKADSNVQSRQQRADEARSYGRPW